MRLPFVLLVAALAGAFVSPAAQAGTKLLRFPDVCGDRVVFTYAGDLWTVSTQGGTASRLTAGPGLEQSARFSPDCSRIAFTGEYGGDDQVYIDRGRRRRAEAADVLSGAGSAAAALGLRQPGLRLDAGWQVDPVPRAGAIRPAISQSASLHRVRARAACRPCCRCRSPASAAIRRTESRSSTRPSTATSAPGIATSAAGRRICTSTISPRSRPRTSPTIRTPTAIRSGSATAFISSPTAASI